MRSNVFIIRDFDKNASITELMREQNIPFENRVLEQNVVEANYYISKKLNVPLGTKLFCLKRLRIVDYAPRSIETVYIPLSEMQDMQNMDFNSCSLYTAIHAKKGIRMLRHQEDILIAEANEEERNLLQLEPEETEIQLIKGIGLKSDNHVFEYFEISSVPEFYRYRSISYLL